MGGSNQEDVNAREELAICIAGMPMTLGLGDLNRDDRLKIAERYSAFATSEDRPNPGVTLEIEPGPPFIPFHAGSTWQIRTSERGGRIEFESHREQGWMDRMTGEGLLVMRPEGNPENFLRVMYAWLCLESDGLLLHAAGIVREERGYVFFGPSGSGKTTITRLSLDHTVLSDDLVILRREGEAVRVYGVPFRGDMPEAPRTNVSAELDGLLLLVKDSYHHITPVSTIEAVARLASCVPFVMTGPGNAARVMDICSSIQELMPVRALHFRPDSGFWRAIDGAL